MTANILPSNSVTNNGMHMQLLHHVSDNMNVSSLLEELFSLSITSEKDKLSILTNISEAIDTCWALLDADHISRLEIFHEDNHNNQREREQAAFILSKTYYHLGDYEQSLVFALAAGQSIVDWSSCDEWIQVLKSKAIDMYLTNPNICLSKSSARLVSIIDEIIERAISLGQFHEAVGIALSSGRIDICRRTIELSYGSSKFSLLQHMYNGLISIASDSHKQILSLLAVEFQAVGSIEGILLGITCWLQLEDFLSIASFIKSLFSSIHGNSKAPSVLVQVTIFISENATRSLLLKITDALDLESKGILLPLLEGHVQRSILLEFLSRNNHIDSLVLTSTKAHLSVKSSLHHSALAVSQGISACGTTSDGFFRNSMDFISHASNWAKFTTTATLGVIHRGQSPGTLIDLLSSYLPSTDNTSSSPYSEGGALFAMGLAIAAPSAGGSGFSSQETLADIVHPHLTLENISTTEPRQHGAALSAGLLALGTSNPKTVELLKTLLFSGSAVSGEAAAIGLGLTLLGDPKEALELLRFATSTPPESCHDKVIRGISISIALMLAGTGDAIARPIIDEMSAAHSHPELRAGAQLALALSFVTLSGDASSEAISRLLSTIGSDQNPEVRRSAAIALGFGLLSSPSHLLALADRLLAGSFSPHVRYGICISLGMTMSNTGNLLATRILTGLATSDPIDFVRQGALIGLSLVLMNLNIPSTSVSIRRLFEKSASSRNEDPLAKFGAILAQGIVDAGGKNHRVRLLNSTGHRAWASIAGAVLFSYYSWCWFPLSHMLCLALAPSSLIGITVTDLNCSIRIPEFKSSLKIDEDQVLTTYFPPIKKEENVVKSSPSVSAVLSITAKTRARQEAKKTSKVQMDVVDSNGDDKDSTNINHVDISELDSNNDLHHSTLKNQNVVDAVDDQNNTDTSNQLSTPVRVSPELINMPGSSNTDPSAVETTSDAIGRRIALPSIFPTSCDEAEAIANMLASGSSNISTNTSSGNVDIKATSPSIVSSTRVDNFTRLLMRHSPYLSFEDPLTKSKCRFQPLITQGQKFYLSTIFTVMLDTYQGTENANLYPITWIDTDFDLTQ